MYKKKLFFLFLISLLSIPTVEIVAGTLPPNPVTITKAKCETTKTNGGEGGACQSRNPAPSNTRDGCVEFDTFVGFCDNPSWGCCVPKIDSDITTTAQCLAFPNTAGVRCSNNDANCFKLNTDTNVWARIGYCDNPANSCCLAGGAGGGTQPGSEFHCKNTLKGACIASTTCTNGGTKLADCTADQGGAMRICCSIPTPPPVGVFNYSLLEQIPGASGTGGDLPSYLRNLYTFTFWAIGIAALFMLTVGGFMYVTAAGNTSRVETAKTVITDALLGILVAIFAWLFLYVINPDLSEGLTVSFITPTPSAPSQPQPPAAAGTDVKSLAQQILADGNISLSSSGDCRSASGAVSPRSNIEQAAADTAVTRCQAGCPGTGLCTGATGLSPTMLQAMLTVAKTYRFTVTSIAGGSHGGGSSHYSGRAIDISTDNKAQWPDIITAFRNAGSNGGQTACDYNGTFLPSSRCSEANHIHVGF